MAFRPLHFKISVFKWNGYFWPMFDPHVFSPSKGDLQYFGVAIKFPLQSYTRQYLFLIPPLMFLNQGFNVYQDNSFVAIHVLSVKRGGLITTKMLCYTVLTLKEEGKLRQAITPKASWNYTNRIAEELHIAFICHSVDIALYQQSSFL